MKLEITEKRKAIPFVLKILIAFLAVILFPIILIIGILYYSWGLILSMAAWVVWGTRGQNILLVYSDSPIWSNYFEQEIFPHLHKKAVLLNWSERKQWKTSLAVLIFKHFGGHRDFNPMAIVFRPFRLNREFRFYQAFRDFKHGKTTSLEILTLNLLDAI